MTNYEEILKDIMRYFNKDYPVIPDRVLDRDANRILKVYKDTYSRILDYLIKELSINGDLSGINHNTYMSIMAQIDQMLLAMGEDVRSLMTEVIEKEFITGAVYHYAVINGVTDIGQIMRDIPFSQINWSMANQIIEDTMEDLLYSTSFTEKSIKKLVKETVSKHLQMGALEGESYKVLKRQITKDLTAKGLSKTIKDRGFVGIIDKSGRRWNILNYVDVVVKTKMQQAYTEGLKEQSLVDGFDLAQIPHKSAKDTCSKFEGMIISMTGKTKGYYTYDQLKATNLIFHPRCRHTPVPIHSLESLHPDDVAEHKQKMKGIKNLSKKTKK
ncbi:TPA: hypothetical protein KOX39_003413 [Clostridioides difficile]|nr:hypothetical protein [Clostridioides difficile]